MPTPLELYFPPSFIEETIKAIEKEKRLDPRYSQDPVHRLAAYTRGYRKNIKYGFLEYLAADIYAPTREERIKHNIMMFNCTLVIQPLSQLFEAHGIEHEIVQFLGFRTIQGRKDREDPLGNEHFAIVCKIEKEGVIKEYLADPYQQVFGEITEKKEKYWKIRRYQDFKKARREFQAVLYYTREEYAQLLYDLRDDAKSLDMLVAGQKIRESLPVAKINCQLMLYYADEPPALTTRLYIPQIGITDKAIHCTHYFNPQGKRERHELTLSLARTSTWHSLVEEQRVAVTDFPTLHKIKRLLGKKTNFSKQPRISELLLDEEIAKNRDQLLSIAGALYEGLSPEQQDALKPLVFMRTLYEAEAAGQEYVYNEERRDQRIKDMLREDIAYRDKLRTLDDLTWNNYWNFARTPKNELRASRRKKKALEKEREERKFGELNRFRKYNTAAYHRTMDKILFAQEHAATLSEDFDRLVDERMDWRIGYLAMVTDFIPYALEAKKELMLDLFMGSLERRVRARLSEDTL
jgi:hypothetical protein